MRNAVTIGATWIVLASAFLTTADRLPWEASLSVVGFLWGFLPLVITRGQRPAVGAASVASFGAATSMFLAATWVSLTVMGGIGSIVFDLDPSYSQAAVRLSVVGLLGLGAVLAGVLAGRFTTGARRRSSGG